MSLAWSPSSSDGRWDGIDCHTASLAIPSLGPDGNELWTDLYLRVEANDDGEIEWDVSISEEEAGFGDAEFDSGVAATVPEAMAACEAAASRIVAAQERDI